MKTVVLLLVSALSAFAAPRTLKDFLARRDYDSAVTYYTRRLMRDTVDTVDIRNLARVYDHWHKYDSSLVWWGKALELNPKDDSSIIGRWNSLYHRDEKDSTKLITTKELIAKEAAAFLAESTERNLTLTYEGLSLSDTVTGPKVAWLLAERFPDSPDGYTIIENAFYDSLYPVWTNDTAKIPIIRRFLTRLPKTEWRQTFYMFMLSSFYGLRDTAGLRAAAREMTADDTLDPFRCRYAAALFNMLKFDPMTAEAYARRAIALEPDAKKPKNKPQEQWDIEYPALYGQARAALAEALIAQGRYDDAELWLDQATAHFRWDANQEATPAAFYCLDGEMETKENDTAEAVTDFLKAMSFGDSRNLWTARADTGLQQLGIRGSGMQIDLGREQLHYAGATFTDVTDSAGLAGRKESRVAWGDYNNDGYDDLLLNGCRLFRNDAGRHFTDVTDSVGLTGASGRGGVWADYDNDGWLDFYMPGADTVDRLWHNDSGRFHDATVEAGYPSDPYPTEGVGWADFDNDGWVDLYSANYENWEKHSYYPDKLYQNQRGSFKDVTKPAGIIPPYAEDLAGRGINWGDYDDDGFQDCYVADYRLTQNLLWHNNHDSTFTNLAAQLGVSGDEVNGVYGHTIGAAWGDYDNDGDLDLFTADLAHPRYIEFSNRSRLYQNQGPNAKPRFVDRRSDAGIRYEETHSDPAWADVDNDGDLDLYITSIYEGRRSFLYQNNLPARPVSPFTLHNSLFSEVTWLSGTRAFNGWGCAFSDFDNDGDMDLVVGSGSGVRLFRNDTKNGNHWLAVKVIGRNANRAGIGCRVTVIKRNKRRQLREVEGGKGTTSQNSLVQHFGLGVSDAPVSVEVRFGPGRVKRLTKVQPDQLITVTE